MNSVYVAPKNPPHQKEGAQNAKWSF